MNVLILGGTTEASAIAAALVGHPVIRPVLSLAGRTRAPVLPPIPCRVGGFGGVAGLAAYLDAHRIAALIDATHPFAAQITRHAAAAAGSIPRITVLRPPWTAQPGDDWTMVPDMPAAAAAIGSEPRGVFLTVGQQELAPFRHAPHHRYVVRSVEPPDPSVLPGATIVTARGPFAEADDLRLMQAQRIEVLVTKNSGGAATAGKLAAAQALGVRVVMVARPPVPDGPTVPDAAAALAWLDHVAATWKRGV